LNIRHSEFVRYLLEISSLSTGAYSRKERHRQNVGTQETFRKRTDNGIKAGNDHRWNGREEEGPRHLANQTIGSIRTFSAKICLYKKVNVVTLLVSA